MPHYKIAENGESPFHIVAHQYADETIRYAASELQKYLLKSTNAAIPYFSDRCPMQGPEIRIGPNVRGESEVPTGLSEKEGFRIYGKDEHIYITANSSRGVLYGVYDFLERFCGFACFTKDAEKIDAHPCLEIELDEICVEPAFEFRDTYFRFAFDGDFCAKNRSNTSLGDVSVAKGGRMKWFNFHHSFRDLVPETTYFESHPEYYSEIEGVRTQNSQLCLTNPDVARVAEETLRRWIRENPECRVFSVAQNDNQRRCTCKSCLALEEKEGSPAGPIIHFVNRLADAIKDDYPNILLHTFAYQYTLPAPKHVIARDNIIVRLCSISCRFDTPVAELALTPANTKEAEFVNALYGWQSHAKRLYVWDYAVNFRNYLQPFLHLHTLQKNLQFFKKLGIKGILEQGNFAYGGGGACDDLKSYIISRLLWDPYIDVDREIRGFCETVYGKQAGDTVAQYFMLVMAACEGAPLGIYQHPDALYITDELIDRSQELLDRATALAENETLRERIDKERLSMRFLRLARMPLDTPGRTELVDAFFNDVKRHGITEIRERRSLAFSKQIMLEYQYLKKRGGYSLYYIMQ
jgi:hypothetical protein